jgi:predicted phage terminase large subunit-like protein
VDAWTETALRIATLAPHVFAARWERTAATDPEAADELLRMRFRYDRAAMLRYCFPDFFPDQFNAFHRAVLDRDWPTWKEREDRGEVLREADAAPRGFGKTTLTKGEIGWAAVYDVERSVVVISNEQSLAIEITADLRDLFLNPSPEFAQLYGPFRVEGGVEKFAVTFPAGHAVRFRAKSMGSQIRGLSRGGVRPTLVLLDDAERSDRVRSPKQRRHWWEVLTADILKLGKAKGGLYCRVRGTVLHPDSGLNNLLKPETPGWRSTKFKACIRRPDREDLWNECGAIYKDLTLGPEPERIACAEAFYAAHRAEMDAGAAMLDPAWLSVFKFYKRIWDEGLKSVLQELQNEPRAAGTKFFQVLETAPGKGDGFARCRVVGDRKTGGYVEADTDRPGKGRRVKLADLRVFMRLDPIPGDELGTMGDEGGSGAGDFACIVVLGRDAHGYGYVLDVWLRRARDSEQIAALWALGEKWGAEKATMESNGFQRILGREFRRQQAERMERGEYFELKAEDDNSSKNKIDRIASLEGPATARWIQFAEHIGEETFGQFDAFPDGDHDDAPDAVEGAWRLSQISRVGMSTTPLGVNGNRLPSR